MLICLIFDVGFRSLVYIVKNKPNSLLLLTFVSGFLSFLPLAPALADDGCDQAVLKEIKGHVILPKNCIYQRSIQITDSNTVLDCQGSTFVGDGRVKVGLLIDSEGKPMSNVIVKNCTFQNFESSGVRVTWSEKDVDKGSDRNEIYRKSPTNILLENIKVENSGRNGIYIDDYVTNVILKDSVVQNSGGGAVYLEFSSKRNKLINNKFIRNGFGLGGEGGSQREAVSIDSSSENIIEGNTFQENSAGGIFLYKNCGEKFLTGNQVIRWMHSDNNIISKNNFKNEKIGIWIASRQSRDLSKWGCGDAPIEPSGTYYQDFANSNKIIDNSFCRVAVPIRNEGDDNNFIGNKFDLQGKTTIEQPVTMRQRLLGKSTVGTVIQKSKAIVCDGF